MTGEDALGCKCDPHVFIRQQIVRGQRALNAIGDLGAPGIAIARLQIDQVLPG